MEGNQICDRTLGLIQLFHWLDTPLRDTVKPVALGAPPKRSFSEDPDWHRGFLVSIKTRLSSACHGLIIHGMKPLPAPHVPGDTEFQRFDNAMRKILSVSKSELLKREAEEKKARGNKRRPSKA